MRGGAGPNALDAPTALELCFEKGKAPDRFIATHTTNDIVDSARP
jgi:hypothetical protein